MSGGLLALLDDIAAIAKVAAASLDDVAAQAAKAGTKAAGVVIDDAAVTPRYVVGFSADRELPIVGRIALGSLKNKLLFLLPGALLLSLLAPWAITPLLMAGGLYLCFEGYEKLASLLWPAAGDHAVQALAAERTDRTTLEDARVASAIRTDFILSAEIMAITLAAVDHLPFAQVAAILGVVGLFITAAVYGAVALIVKADDFGLMLARRQNQLSRVIGRAIVRSMPGVLAALSTIGTVAMLWVGGGIVIHGLAELGLAGPEHAVKGLTEGLERAIPAFGPLLAWAAGAAIAAAIGALIGWGVERAWRVAGPSIASLSGSRNPGS